jgi:hypothetical protein
MSGPERGDERRAPVRDDNLDLREEWSATSAPSEPGPSPAAPSSALDRRSARASSPGSVRGIARSVDLRYEEQYSSNTLRFRVDRYDAAGDRLAPVAVEMRFHRRGQISDGDEVDVAGSPTNGTLVAKRIINVTTASDITGGVPSWAKAALVVAGLAVLAVASVIVFFLVHDSKSYAPPAGGARSEVVLPQLAGQDLANSYQLLQAEGLHPQVRAEANPATRLGTVVRTEPAGGVSVPAGSTVTVIVSNGVGR